MAVKTSLQIIFVQSKKIKEFDELTTLYLKKLSSFTQIELIVVKAEDQDRKNKEIKKERETQKILEKIQSDDFVILCDEKGRAFASEGFADFLVPKLDLYKKIIVVVGGAFGVGEALKTRAQASIKLSDFVMNHHVAKIVLLEQIFRAFTLARGIPYHNE